MCRVGPPTSEAPTETRNRAGGSSHEADRPKADPRPAPLPPGEDRAGRSADAGAGRDRKRLSQPPIACRAPASSFIASQLVAKRSSSSAMSCVQPWQKAPRQALTHPVVQRVLTPQAGSLIAGVRAGHAPSRSIRRPGNTAARGAAPRRDRASAAPRSYAPPRTERGAARRAVAARRRAASRRCSPAGESDQLGAWPARTPSSRSPARPAASARAARPGLGQGLPRRLLPGLHAAHRARRRPLRDELRGDRPTPCRSLDEAIGELRKPLSIPAGARRGLTSPRAIPLPEGEGQGVRGRLSPIELHADEPPAPFCVRPAPREVVDPHAATSQTGGQGPARPASKREDEKRRLGPVGATSPPLVGEAPTRPKGRAWRGRTGTDAPCRRSTPSCQPQGSRPDGIAWPCPCG